MEVIPDPVYFGLMGVLMHDIAFRWGCKTHAVVVRSVNAYFGFSLWSEFRRNALLNWAVMRQWLASFGSLATQVAYRSSSWSRPLEDTRDLVRSYRIWQKWCAQECHIAMDCLDIDGIVCGDLIIDSYLRLAPSPSFKVDDIFVWRLLWQATRDVGRARSYFRKHRPALYLTTYSTYIEHGIPARVALQEGIPVFSFGNFFKFGLRLTADHDRHTPDCRDYRQGFEVLPPELREACMEEAEKTLEFRMSGGIDHATGYMRNSAYAPAQKNQLTNHLQLKGAVVVFLHDFYDSPHVWDDFVFTDFWDWIITTIDALKKLGVNFVIKPHPNQIALSDQAIVDLREKYPGLMWLDTATNNRMLAEAGISCGVTVYGTVAHELAYLGIPTIGAASHAHHSFNFCRTARSRSEYLELLSDCLSVHMPRTDMRKEALGFFSMHNSLYDETAREVTSAFMQYWMLSARAKSTQESEKAIKALDSLRKCTGYEAFISMLSPYFESHES